MKVNAMIRIRKDVIIVVLDSRQIELVQERQSILQVHVVVCYTVHDKEANSALKGSRIAYACIRVALRIMLGSVHVALRVDGIYHLSQACSELSKDESDLP